MFRLLFPLCLLTATNLFPADHVLALTQFYQGGQVPKAIRLDGQGNIYIAGTTTTDIPLVNALQSKPGAGNCDFKPAWHYTRCEDLYVAKFDPSGKTLLYSTYIGTDGRDFLGGIDGDHTLPGGMAVDRDGNVYLAGQSAPASLAGFPPISGHAFVIKLAAGGQKIDYWYTLPSVSAARSVAVDDKGNAYVAGVNRELSFPAVNGAIPAPKLRTLLVSRDAGVTWDALTAPPADRVYSIAREPGRPEVLYTATSAGLFRTEDRGAIWTNLVPDLVQVTQVALDPRDVSVVYALASWSAGGRLVLRRSKDRGATWTALSDPELLVWGFDLDSRNPNVLWMAEHQSSPTRILRSEDRGDTWNLVYEFPRVGRYNSVSFSKLLVDPTNSDRVYLCCRTDATGIPGLGLFRTDDGGKTWMEGAQGPFTGEFGIGPPVLDPAFPSTLWASWGRGAARSDDAGATWREVYVPSVAGRSNSALAVDPVTHTVYLAGNDGSLLYSADGGLTWDIRTGPWRDDVRLFSAVDGEIWASSAALTQEYGFVAKLDPSGQVLWSTLVHGDGLDRAEAIALDAAGDAYVAGEFAPDSTQTYLLDVYTTKLRGSDGTPVYWKTFGGRQQERATAITVDADGSAWVAGSTASADFPQVNPIPGIDSTEGNTAAFLTKLSPDDAQILLSTRLGGFYPTAGANDIALDPSGAVWLAGTMRTPDFPLVQPFQTVSGTDTQGFLARIPKTGGALEFSSAVGLGQLSSLALAGDSIWLAGYGDPLREATTESTWQGRPWDLLPRTFLAKVTLGRPPTTDLRIDEVRNAASLLRGELVSPGELVHLVGSNLAVGETNPIVTLGGKPVTVLSAMPAQVRIVIPDGISGWTATLELKAGDRTVTRTAGD